MEESVSNQTADDEEEGDVEEEEDLADGFEAGKCVGLLAEERGYGAGGHCHFEPGPGEVIQALWPGEVGWSMVACVVDVGVVVAWFEAPPGSIRGGHWREIIC